MTEIFQIIARLIESITVLRKGRGNPIQVSKIFDLRQGLWCHGCNKSWTQWVTSSLPQYSDYFFSSCLHMYKISILTHWIPFPACFALTFCDRLYNLLPELACHTSQGMTTFHSTLDLAEFNRIYHHIAEGTMGSHPSVRDLQSMTRLVMAWM